MCLPPTTIQLQIFADEWQITAAHTSRLKRLAGRMPLDLDIFAHAEGCVGINTSSFTSAGCVGIRISSLNFAGCVGIRISSLIFAGCVGIKMSFWGFPQLKKSGPPLLGRSGTLVATVGRTIAKDEIATTMANLASDIFFISI